MTPEALISSRDAGLQTKDRKIRRRVDSSARVLASKARVMSDLTAPTEVDSEAEHIRLSMYREPDGRDESARGHNKLVSPGGLSGPTPGLIELNSARTPQRDIWCTFYAHSESLSHTK